MASALCAWTLISRLPERGHWGPGMGAWRSLPLSARRFLCGSAAGGVRLCALGPFPRVSVPGSPGEYFSPHTHFCVGPVEEGSPFLGSSLQRSELLQKACPSPSRSPLPRRLWGCGDDGCGPPPATGSSVWGARLSVDRVSYVLHAHGGTVTCSLPDSSHPEGRGPPQCPRPGLPRPSPPRHTGAGHGALWL